MTSAYMVSMFSAPHLSLHLSFLRQGHVQLPRLALNSFYSQSWPWIQDPECWDHRHIICLSYPAQMTLSWIRPWRLLTPAGSPFWDTLEHLHSREEQSKATRRKTNAWILHSSLEQGTKYPRKELQRQSLELRRKDGPSRDCPTRDPSHNQPPNTDTIAYARKIFVERILLYLSLVRLCQCLANIEVDAHSHLLDGTHDPQQRSLRKYPRNWRGLQPYRWNNNMN